MAFRIEKRTLALLTGLLALAPAVFAQQDLRYEAWHGHPRPPHIRKAGGMGALAITASGISFEETHKKGKSSHAWRWAYQDIQQLTLAPKSIKILTYKDNVWKLGADRSYEFDLVSGKTFADAYDFLKSRLDQRFVAEMPDKITEVLWELPVKHLRRFGGDEGVLQAGRDMIVYKSSNARETRAWRYEDIDNVSSSGPFQLTITTFERARTHYGDRKGFNFELKQRLSEDRYNDLWQRLNRTQGVQILDSYREPESGQ